MIAKPALVSGLLLVVAAIALVAPWYPVTTSQIVPQTQSYTTQFQAAVTNYQTVTVYTLPEPAVLSILTAPYAFPKLAFVSENFNLQTGVTYTLTVDQCQQCFLSLGGAGSQDSGAYISGIYGSGQETFVAPASGPYFIGIINYGSSTSTVNAISITASIPQSAEVTQTLTNYSTTSVTQYSQTIVPFYTILGALPSIVIIGILVIAVLLLAMRSRRITHKPTQATLSQYVKTPTSCIRCGAELPLASKFCKECGSQVS